MKEKTEYPELRKELSRLVELQSKNFLTNEADNLIKELQLVLGNPSPALQDAVKEIAFPVSFDRDKLEIIDSEGGCIVETFDYGNIELALHLAHCINKLNS